MEKALSYSQIRDKVNRAIDGAALFIWKQIEAVILATGEVMTFATFSVRAFFSRPLRLDELVTHMEFIGNKSIFIIALTGFFTGAALSYQIYLGFKLVNATSLVGPTVGLGITRELGPVLTGLIVAARAGGAMAARLGTMRVSEQIDALEVMGVEPRQYLVSPRIVASVLTMPLLTGIFDFVAMAGSWLLCIQVLEMDEAAFFDRTQLWLQPSHINEGLFKAAVFGLFFSIVCTHRGFTTTGGAAGVGNSTNRGVVLSMVLIIVSDFFLTSMINFFYAVTGMNTGGM
ncbi:MAG: ABC transporter permease [Bdellovibrionaceae bacterium]|nr:ABC transporter permease [Pseudobdellovibrionaceae bacterium]